MAEATLEYAKQLFIKIQETSNDNNEVNIEIVKKLFSNELNKSLTDIHVKNMFNDKIDELGNGQINFNEFLTVFSFLMYDYNADDYIEQAELKQLMNIFFENKISDQEAQNGILKLDNNSDGKISYIEWRKFIQGQP